MTPKCCQECEVAKNNGYEDSFCIHAKTCARWRKWFRSEWKDIRKAAEQIKATKAERCVSCGEIIPEGRQVCPNCEKGGVNYD